MRFEKNGKQNGIYIMDCRDFFDSYLILMIDMYWQIILWTRVGDSALPLSWSSVSKWITLRQSWQSLREDSSPTVNSLRCLCHFVTVASFLVLWAVVTAITVLLFKVTVMPSLGWNINTCCLNVQRFYLGKVLLCWPTATFIQADCVCMCLSRLCCL